MGKIIAIHADDFGRSPSITADIITAVSAGTVTGVSMMATGASFDGIATAAAARPDLFLRLHLNLTEGAPLSDPISVPHLVNEHQHFASSPAVLWMRYLIAEPDVKAAMAHEVRTELALQFARAIAAAPNTTLGIDGHQHVHLVPFVMREIVALSRAHAIRDIRCAYEPVHIPLVALIHHPLSTLAGYIRLFVFNASVWRARKVLLGAIPSPHAIAGVLGSGMMTEEHIASAIAAASDYARVEVIMHPGGASQKERSLFDQLPQHFWEFYSSSERSKERDLLCAPNFAERLHLMASNTHRFIAEKISRYLWLLIKFVISGTTAALVHMTVAYAALHFVALRSVIATGIGFIAAFGVSFVMQKYWTFEDTSREGVSRQLGQYFVTGVLGLLGNMSIVYVLDDLFGIMPMIAIFIGALSVSVGTFAIYKYIIFRRT